MAAEGKLVLEHKAKHINFIICPLHVRTVPPVKNIITFASKHNIIYIMRAGKM